MACPRSHGHSGRFISFQDGLLSTTLPLWGLVRGKWEKGVKALGKQVRAAQMSGLLINQGTWLCLQPQFDEEHYYYWFVHSTLTFNILRLGVLKNKTKQTNKWKTTGDVFTPSLKFMSFEEKKSYSLEWKDCLWVTALQRGQACARGGVSWKYYQQRPREGEPNPLGGE